MMEADPTPDEPDAAAPDLEVATAPETEPAPSEPATAAVEVAIKTTARYYYFPIVTLALGAIQWGIFLWGLYNISNPELEAVAGKDIYARVSPPKETYWFMTVNYWPSCTDARSNTWRLISYQFAHSSFAHIWGNTFILALFGIPLELFHPYRGLAVFAAHELAVIFGALSFSWLNPYRGLVGSSAGVYGIVGATISHLIFNGQYLPDIIRETDSADFYYLIYRIYAGGIVAIHIEDIVSYFAGYKPNVAYSAHFSGWIIGIFVGAVFALMTRDVRKYPVWKIVCASVGAAGFVGQCIFLIYHYTRYWPPEPARAYPQHYSCCAELWDAVEADHTLTLSAARDDYTCPQGNTFGIVKKNTERGGDFFYW